MLTQVADGVLVHGSGFCGSNAVVVEGPSGVLLIDPGVRGDELAHLADDLRDRGLTVVAGFSTHPHWDHLLWHPGLGAAPRYATARCAAVAGNLLATEGWRDRVAQVMPADLVPLVPLELFGQVTGLPDGAESIPWDGPRVRIVEHRAHAAGHAALLIEDRGVLVAGDMLSDALVPILDQRAADPIADHLDALRLIGQVAGHTSVVVPGHGSVGGAAAVQARLDSDRAYVLALRDGEETQDVRVGPAAAPGWEWVRGLHEGQVQAFAARREQDGAPA